MDIAKHQYLFSHIRLSRYMRACGNDPIKTVDLYKLNIQLSQAFYPILSILEVALRNAVDREMAKYLRDSNWLLNKRNEFATNPQLTYKDHNGRVHADLFFIHKIKHAEDKLKTRSITISNGKLLAELTFGFWVKFFDRGPIRILKGTPLRCFRMPPSIPAKGVHAHLNSLVTLRNRISHNEPVCFDKVGKVCLDSIENLTKDISLVLGWIDTDLKNWAEEMNFFRPLFDRLSTLETS